MSYYYLLLLLLLFLTRGINNPEGIKKLSYIMQILSYAMLDDYYYYYYLKNVLIRVKVFAKMLHDT